MLNYKFPTSSLINLLFKLISIVILLILTLILYSKTHFFWDVPILIDGSYKVSQGQLPHVDFFTPFSQLIFTFTSFGLKIFPNTMLGINLGLVILSLFLSLIAYRSISLSYKYSNNYKFIILMICLILMVPRLQHYPDIWSHLGIYNRLSYGILGTVIITLMPYIFNRTDKIEPLLWVGLLIASLLYIKITYFIFALLFLPMIVIFNFNIRQLKYLIISIFTCILILGFTIGWDFLSFYYDLKYLYYVSSNGLFLDKINKIRQYFHPFYFILWFLITLFALEKSKSINKKIIILLLGLYILFVDMFINFTISQPYENFMNVIFVLCLIGLGYLSDLFNLFKSLLKKMKSVSIKKLGLLMDFLYLADYSNIFKNLLKRSKSITIKKLVLITGSLLTLYHISLHINLYTYKLFRDSPTIIKNNIIKFDINKKYESKLYASLPLNVKKEINKNTKLLIVGENDDISFSLNITSPDLPVLYWHKGQTFIESSKKIDKRFTAKSIFKNIDIIILKTKGLHTDTVKSFMSMYEAYINKNFEILPVLPDENFKVYFKPNYLQ